MAIKFQNTRVKETILETPRENSYKEIEIKLCQTFHLDNTGYKKTIGIFFNLGKIILKLNFYIQPNYHLSVGDFSDPP